MKPATLILLFLTLFVASLLGQPVPSDSGTQEGNSGTLYPFSYGYTRYQQVNAASDFGGPVGPGGIFFQGMFLRLDSPNGFSFAGYATNLQLNLSTTFRQPDSLSPVFSENVGGNDQIVFGPTTPRLAADYIGGRAPQSWTVGIWIPFSQPFFYRPTDGNLLLDIRLFNGSTAGSWIDAWNRSGDSVSSVYGNIDDLSGTTTTLGFSTLFYGTLVPEPSTCFIFALGSAALLLLRKKRKP